MVRRVLFTVAAVATAVTLSTGAAGAAEQQCGVSACFATNVCDETSAISCHFCVLPDYSPVVPCMFGH